MNFLFNGLDFGWLTCLVSALSIGVVSALINHSSYYYIISFYAICGVIPYYKGHQNKLVALLMVSFIISISWCLLFVIISKASFCIVILIIGFVLGYMETKISNFKIISSWVFIRILYSYVEMKNYRLVLNYGCLSLIYFLTMLSLLFSFLIVGSIVQGKRVKSISVEWGLKPKEILFYFKYVVFLILGFIACLITSIDMIQWLLWSGLTVLSFDLSVTHTKLKKRLFSGSIGISIGLLIVSVFGTVTNNYFLGVCYILILLSLRSFKEYSYGFCMRCGLVVIFASSQYLALGEMRLESIIIGGVVGYISSLLLFKSSQLLLYKKR